MSDAASLTVRVPLSIRRRPGRKTVVTPEGTSPVDSRPVAHSHGDPALVKAPARAFRYQRLLDEGQYESITEMAETQKLDRGYMGRLLQLTLLAPEIVQAVLDGLQYEHLDLPSLMKPLSVDWGQHGSALA